MKQPEELKKDYLHQEDNVGGGYSSGGSYPSGYKKPFSATQIAWRVGLFVLGAIVGAIIANL